MARIAALVATLVSAGAYLFDAGPVILFACSTVALALLAAVIGEATTAVGERLGPAVTGVLQAAIANMPEFFVTLFALRAGLVTVVQTALVGSILANSLLVLGLAFFVGGIKHGRQKFSKAQPRMIATLTLLAVSAMILPTLAAELHTPAANHETALGVGSAILLFLVFLASIPESIADPQTPLAPPHDGPAAPLTRSIATLVAAGVGAAFVSDWFVEALMPTMAVLGISEAFAGLVIVAIAGNAVENVVGIQMAARNQTDFAISIILNSSLQVALALVPLLVMASFFVAPVPLTLVMPPLLVAALLLAALLSAFIVFDGESTWLEGVALIGLYVLIAMAVWWG